MVDVYQFLEVYKLDFADGYAGVEGAFGALVLGPDRASACHLIMVKLRVQRMDLRN